MSLYRQRHLVNAVRVALLVLGAVALGPRPASAELTFCNDAAVALSTAVAQYDASAEAFVARGWYNLDPGECTDVVGGDLDNRYYYVYAQKPDGSPITTDGTAPFCTTDTSFSFSQKAECDSDLIHLFLQVDNGDATSRAVHFQCTDCLDTSLEDAVRAVLPTLESFANDNAPSAYETPDWVDVGPADIQFRVELEPVSLSLTGSKLSIRARAHYWIQVSNLILGVRVDTASCGLGEDPRLVDAEMSTVLGQNAAGSLVTHTRIDDLSFPNRCNLTLADIDVTDQIDAAVRRQLQELADAFDAEVRKLDIQ
jgi:uncharacterized membrane protein